MQERVSFSEIIRRNNVVFEARRREGAFETNGIKMALIDNTKIIDEKLDTFQERERELIEKHATTDQSGNPLEKNVDDNQQLPPNYMRFQYEDPEAMEEDRNDALQSETTIQVVQVPRRLALEDEGNAPMEILEALDWMFE